MKIFEMGRDVLRVPKHNTHSRDGRERSVTDAFFILGEIDDDPNAVYLVGKSTHPPLRFELWRHPLPDDVAIDRSSQASRSTPTLEFHSLGWCQDYNHMAIINDTLSATDIIFIDGN
jgi:hypothetical protein